MARLLICINDLLIRHPFEACKYFICSVYEILHFSLKNKIKNNLKRTVHFSNLMIRSHIFKHSNYKCNTRKNYIVACQESLTQLHLILHFMFLVQEFSHNIIKFLHRHFGKFHFVLFISYEYFMVARETYIF